MFLRVTGFYRAVTSLPLALAGFVLVVVSPALSGSRIAGVVMVLLGALAWGLWTRVRNYS